MTLPDEWRDYLVSEPETGMGYWVVSVRLRDGRQVDRVVINSGYITQVFGYKELPFEPAEISELWVTHDKWKFNTKLACLERTPPNKAPQPTSHGAFQAVFGTVWH